MSGPALARGAGNPGDDVITDAAFGPDHPRTQTAKATLRGATAAAVHENNTVDIEHTPLVVIDGGLSAAS